MRRGILVLFICLLVATAPAAQAAIDQGCTRATASGGTTWISGMLNETCTNSSGVCTSATFAIEVPWYAPVAGMNSPDAQIFLTKWDVAYNAPAAASNQLKVMLVRENYQQIGTTNKATFTFHLETSSVNSGYTVSADYVIVASDGTELLLQGHQWDGAAYRCSSRSADPNRCTWQDGYEITLPAYVSG